MKSANLANIEPSWPQAWSTRHIYGTLKDNIVI